jgi:hypothetical protein
VTDGLVRRVKPSWWDVAIAVFTVLCYAAHNLHLE